MRCTHACGCQRLIWAVFLDHSLPYLLRYGLSLNLTWSIDMASQASELALGLPCFCLSVAGIKDMLPLPPSFSVGPRDTNYRSHACTSSTLFTKPPP